MSFPIHTIESAPEASRDQLRASQAAFGSIPNLHGELAESPEALAIYNTAYAAFGRSSFTPAEQQFIYLVINYENECAYCMAGHSVLAKSVGLPQNVISAVRDGTPLADQRLDALRRFVAAMVVERGHVGDKAVEAFLAAGFERRQVLEVILAIATKVLSSYTNHVAHTPNDAFMAKTAWTPPSEKTLAA